jgi:hypothetical protein
VIAEARWDRSKNVLYMASEADGWAWELRTFFEAVGKKFSKNFPA